MKEDITIYIDSNKDFRKFELGLTYEDSNGEIQEKFPSSSNKVLIYTIDGKFFFSKKYSEFQQFFSEFSNNRIDFRPKHLTWQGEFGIDWIRRGDFKNATSPDVFVSYKEKIGYYYKLPPNDTIKTANEGEQPSTFKHQKEEWFRLKTLYSSFSLPFGNESLYWNVLYPSMEIDGTPSGFRDCKIFCVFNF